MAFGLYKPGQGYWARVMTACMIGILTLAGAAWMYKQMQVVGEKMHRSEWTVALVQTGNPPTVGQTMELLTTGDRPGDPKRVMGTALVEQYDGASREVRFKDVKLAASDAASNASLAKSMKIGQGAEIDFAATPKGFTAIDPVLLAGGAAAVVLLIGFVIAYWLAGLYKKFVEFLIATDGEMKKVNWSTARDIRLSTMVVIAAAFLLSAALFFVDLSFKWIFTQIGVLVQ